MILPNEIDFYQFAFIIFFNSFTALTFVTFFFFCFFGIWEYVNVIIHSCTLGCGSGVSFVNVLYGDI